MRILLVEDDRTIAAGLCYSLEQEGWQVQVCGTVAAAQAALSAREAELCLFDLSLPDGSGYDLCKLAKQADLPVLILTARDEEVSVVMGLDLGADDYVTKPFRLRELLSRIRSVWRRYHREETAAPAPVLELGPLRVNTLEAKVYKAGREIALTALEYRLLLTFLGHPGQVLSRGQLLESIWDVAGDFVNDNTLTVYIKRLREKLEDDPQSPALIQTVRGLGYRAGGSHAAK